ncbi:LOW QUALITY PROTEIN: hypothetical protein PHPALM_27973 [Phytophthora palmivora]|uniref:Integrase catalytic domain-containing protein n=1 Tax=Phytophthora palmivora TaxID=4796 RepID=A0A2P4XB91_9STRA|nr:LOW QUALITY PROTEIN: hypothetical protein PHPALM_27973 [Phytophthora palmivora]
MLLTVIRCQAANGENVRVRKVGSATLSTIVKDSEVTIDLCEAYYADNLLDNIIRYRSLEKRGVFVELYNGRSCLVRETNKLKVFEVYCRDDMLMIDAMGKMTATARVHAVNAAVLKAGADLNDVVTVTTLEELHKKLGLLAYDTVECNGIGYPTDRQIAAKLSHLCITPKDRDGNRYIINFIDHSTNYTIVEATKKFEEFLTFFEKRFDCKVYALHTDGRKEYVQADPFCVELALGINKRENQASNEKTERMHRAVLNIAHCMQFSSGLPF